MKSLDHTLNDLSHTFQEFKTHYETRLKSLENYHLETKRPRYSLEEDPTLHERRAHKEAFSVYIRKGDTSQLLNFQTKALTSGSSSDGGFLVPTLISDKIKYHIEEISPFRSLASVMTLSSGSVEILLDENTAEVGWTTETGERRETKTPQVNKKKITLHELYARPKASEWLLQDARINVEDWLLTKIGDKMSLEETLAFMYGDGSHKPRGFLSYESLPKEKWTKSTFEHLSLESPDPFTSEGGFEILMDLVHLLPTRYQRGAVWVMSRSAEAAIRKFKDKTGQFLWQPALGEQGKNTLLGYPVVVVDGMPDLTKGEGVPVVFGNFKESYQIVDRAETQILRDPYSSKPYVEFYTTCRVGGDVINFEALKFLKIGVK